MVPPNMDFSEMHISILHIFQGNSKKVNGINNEGPTSSCRPPPCVNPVDLWNYKDSLFIWTNKNNDVFSVTEQEQQKSSILGARIYPI